MVVLQLVCRVRPDPGKPWDTPQWETVKGPQGWAGLQAVDLRVSSAAQTKAADTWTPGNPGGPAGPQPRLYWGLQLWG